MQMYAVCSGSNFDCLKRQPKSDRCVYTSVLSANSTQLSVCTFVQTKYVLVCFSAHPHVFESCQG